MTACPGNFETEMAVTVLIDGGSQRTYIINISRVDGGEISNLFTITTFDTKQKVMVQGSHKDLWLKQTSKYSKRLYLNFKKSTDHSDLAALLAKQLVTILK